jgi:prepilin-type N-terminal cleavage/methylation domain-containing protein
LPVSSIPAAGYRRPTTGFTLIELLISLALISTIVTMLYGSFTAACRSMDVYGSRMACSDRTCLVLRLMARQLRCAYVPTFATGLAPSSPQNGTPSVPPAASLIEPLDSSGEGFSFITTAGLGTGPALSRVMYRCDPSSGTLSICCEPYLYGVEGWQGPRDWRPILNGVRSVDVQLYDGQRGQSGWTGSPSQTLPQGVKIAITIFDEKDRWHEFKTMVPIGCRNAPQEQQVSVPAGKW